jgi:hypothetical protein
MVAELALLASVPLLGNHINNNLDELKENKGRIPSSERPSDETIYDSKNTKHKRDMHRRKARIITKASDDPEKTKVIPQFYNETQFREKNKAYKIKKTSQPRTYLAERNETLDDIGTTDKNYYLDTNKFRETFKCDSKKGGFNDQFNCLSYSNEKKPVSKNDDDCTITNMASSLALSGGWSLVDRDDDMTYGIINKEHMTHTNMQPYMKMNGLQFNKYNDKNRDQRLELFTGSSTSDYYVPKKEVGPLFLPEKNRSHTLTRGMPNHTEYMQSRFQPSRKKTNQKPFEAIRVTPGLNIGYNEEGKHNRHDTYRVMPKTVDELRTLSNPKETYTPPIIAGQRGSKRQVHSAVMKNGPRRTVKVPWDWFQKRGGAFRYEKVYSPVIFKSHRRPHPKPLVGTRGAYYKQILPTERRKLVKMTNRDVYKNRGLRNARGVTMMSGAHNSDYTLAPTRRTEQTDIKQHYPGVRGSVKGGAAHLQDEVRVTQKQNTIHQENYTGAHGVNTAGVVRLQDPVRTTQKQNTIYQEHYTNAHGLTNAGTTHLQDPVKVNQKMNTINQEHYTNVHGMTNAGTVHLQDPIRINQKMNMIHQENYTNVHGINTAGTLRLQDPLQVTQKMNTINQEHYTNVHGINTAGAIRLQDPIRVTQKMNTINQEHYTNVHGINTAGAIRLQDPVRVTQKMNTINQEHYTNVHGINTAGAIRLQDPVRVTQKINTLHRENYTNAHGINTAGALRLQDPLQVTQKQNVIHQEHYTNAHGINTAGTIRLQDPVRINQKMNTIHQENYTNVHGMTNAGALHLQDPVRVTQKQNMIHQEHYTNAHGMQPATKAYQQDPARVTQKQATIHQEHYTNVHGMQPAIKAYQQDPARVTQKQATIHQEHYGNANGIVKAGTSHLHDPVRVTQKQNTIHQEHYGNVNGIVKAGTSHLHDPVRVTQKQATIHQEHYTNVRAIEPGHRVSLAEQNMQLDDRKELANRGRIPTTRGWDKIPNMATGIGKCTLRQPINVDRAYHPKLPLDGTVRPMRTYIMKEDQNNSHNRLDNDILLQLADNPLVNNLVFRHNDIGENQEEDQFMNQISQGESDYCSNIDELL